MRRPQTASANRRSNRLRGYDYTQPGAYFVTICTQNRACLFGDVADGEMRMSAAGAVVDEIWRAIPTHVPAVAVDEFVVMPNHVHGVLVFEDIRAMHASPLRGQTNGLPRRSLGAIAGAFKSAASKRINELHGLPGRAVWQRNYHEHIIRNDESLQQIRRYIRDNPAQWALDRENPAFTGQV